MSRRPQHLRRVVMAMLFAFVAAITIAHAFKTETTTTVSGPARVVDGDTVVVGSTRIRSRVSMPPNSVHRLATMPGA